MIDKENNIKENEPAPQVEDYSGRDGLADIGKRLDRIEKRLGDLCELVLQTKTSASPDQTNNLLVALLRLQSYYVKSSLNPVYWKTVDEIVQDSLQADGRR